METELKTQKELPPVAATKVRKPIAVPREAALGALLILLPVILSLMFPYSFRPVFWSPDNLAAVLRNMAFEGILAVGMMMLLVSGVFDLSIGAMASLGGVVTGWLLKTAGVPIPLAIAGGIGVGALGGFLNGIAVTRFGVNALITTLGTMGIFKGVALLIAGPGITFLPEGFAVLGQSSLLGLQSPVWIMFGLALVAHIALSRTHLFRQLYYIGSNPKAAYLSGINVASMQTLAFTLMGAIAAFAGVVYASRIATASATLGDGKELGAITAVILGGASLSGGRGTIWGALIGVAFVGVVQNILIIMRIPAEWQTIVLGAVLVLAVAADSFFNKREQH